MATDFEDIATRTRDLATDLGLRAQREGKARLRRAVGAPAGDALWLLFGAGLIVGVVAGAAIGIAMAGRSPRDVGLKMRDRFDRAREDMADVMEDEELAGRPLEA